MSYLDEPIVTLRSEVESAHKSTVDLTRTFVIYGETYSFENREFLGGELHMTVPATFNDMPEAVIAQKYLSAEKPQVVLTNFDHIVDISLNRLHTNADTEKLSGYMQQVKRTLSRVNPSILFFEAKEIGGVNVPVHTMDFKSFSLAGPVYNLMFLSALSGKLLLGAFNCPFGQWEDWKPVIEAMAETIKDTAKSLQI